MAKSVNQVILLGRLTSEPDQRTTSTGKNIATFSLAVDRGGEGADFFDITAWEKTADLVSQFLGKGSKVLVQGRLSQDRWEKDGKKFSKVTITAFDVTFLDNKADSKPKDNLPTDEEIDKPIDMSKIPF